MGLGSTGRDMTSNPFSIVAALQQQCRTSGPRQTGHRTNGRAPRPAGVEAKLRPVMTRVRMRRSGSNRSPLASRLRTGSGLAVLKDGRWRGVPALLSCLSACGGEGGRRGRGAKHSRSSPRRQRKEAEREDAEWRDQVVVVVHPTATSLAFYPYPIL